MTSLSEDEWSLVSDNQEVLSEVSFDEVNEGSEVHETSNYEVSKVRKEPLDNQDEALASEEDTNEVLSLLADSMLSERSSFSKKNSLSLLSKAHRKRFAGFSPHYASNHRKTKSSYPERLRAITSASRSPEEVEHLKYNVLTSSKQDQSTQVNLNVVPEQPEYTVVTAFQPNCFVRGVFIAQPKNLSVTRFKQDQSTQVDLDDMEVSSLENRKVLSCEAPVRSLEATNKVHATFQDNERLSLCIAELKSVAVQIEQKILLQEQMIGLFERSLTLVEPFTSLTTGNQDNPQTVANNLRQANAHLKCQIALLRGDGKVLATYSLAELEEVETMLTQAMGSIRGIIRDKYRSAVEKHDTNNLP